MRKNKGKIVLACFFAIVFFASSALASTGASAMSGEEALALLKKNNQLYLSQEHNFSDISEKRRQETSENGQHPYAIILTCADSRVPPEHIFNAGLGELFVMRNAGNLASERVLGSMEYAIEHLGLKLVVVLGHTKCGAVGAALACDCKNIEPSSPLQKLAYDIHKIVGDAKDAREAEILNVKKQIIEIQTEKKLEALLEEQNVLVVGAIYDIHTGAVVFLPN